MIGATRHDLGQWFTPPPVADLAVALALENNPRHARILDPSCGDGAFLRRANQRRGCKLTGIDLDPRAARAARAHLPAADIRVGDFFTADFPGQFDAVVGNPPYVRNERLSSAAKQNIQQCLLRELPGVPKGDLLQILRRGDLAAPFVLRALHLCKPGGRVALVVSGALLDAEYAQLLWRAVARIGRVRFLIDAPEERWFADAAVNAMILVAEPVPASAGDQVTVARLKVPVATAAQRVSDARGLSDVAELRTACALSPRAWGEAVRSPATWFDFKASAGKSLVPLGQLAEVSRGTTSGANELFYLERQRARSLGLEASVLWPLVRSPRDFGSGHIELDPQTTRWLALMLPANPTALARYPRAAAYLGQAKEAQKRPTLRARPLWWALPGKPAELFLTKSYAQRFVQPFARCAVIADQRMYVVRPRGIPVWTLAAVLNSTYTAFSLEALGRASLGEGAMEWTVADAKELPVIDPRCFSVAEQRAVRAAYQRMLSRPIGSVFAEAEAGDRRTLDRALGVPKVAALLPAIHEALCAQVARRSRRARGGASATP